MSFRQLEGGRISSRELWFMASVFLLGSSVLIPPGTAAGRDAWAAVIAGSVGGMVVTLVYTQLGSRFPGKTFVEISHGVFGNVIGKVVSLLFVWYLVHLASLVLTNFGDFFTATVYRLTPGSVIVGALILVASYALSHGLEVLARSSIPIFFVILTIVVLDTALLLNRFDPRNLLPVLEVRPAVFAWSSLAAASFPFAETVAFLMLFPAVRDGARIRRAMLRAGAAMGLIFTMIAIRNSAVLGRGTTLYTYPSIQALRLVSFGGVITRAEVLVSTVLIATGFLKFAVLFYGAALGLAQTLRLSDYRAIIRPLGAVLLVMSLFNFNSVSENIRFAVLTYPIYGLFFQLALPAGALVIAGLKARLARSDTPDSTAKR